MKKITLVALAFVAFSCSTDSEERKLKSVSITEIAKATPELSSFVEALEITGLAETFDGQGDFTVFVPDNAAFDNLLISLGYTELSEVDPTLLANILEYHVIDSKVLTTDLTNGTMLTTSYGQDVTINIDTTTDAISVTDNNGLTADSNVVARDVKCSNGTIQRVDAVLVPNMGS